jgi:hypothetical protein
MGKIEKPLKIAKTSSKLSKLIKRTQSQNEEIKKQRKSPSEKIRHF